MANYRQLQVARKRGYGTFEHLTIHIEFYNNSGKGKGANRQHYIDAKNEAKEHFKHAFDCFKENVKTFGWDYRVCFEFNDGEG